ncbi:hypothetical protein F5148DRAFT_990497, partial [Russula earlei]
GWTTTHGFFAIMGGFMEYEGNRPNRVLLPEELNSYSLTGNGDFPRIAKEEIEDKSKGDAISKALVILQTNWFVVQCIARGVQGLPVTELELVTVAFATLNFVMYLLWWDKPLNVQRGVRVYKKRDTDEPIDDGDIEATRSVGFWDALGDALSDLGAAIVRGPMTEEPEMATWLIRDLAYTMRVNTFHPRQWLDRDDMNFYAGVAVVVVTLAFGGIHCIGWSFAFPSGAEHILWRVASVTITTFPILLIPAGFSHSSFANSLYFALVFIYMLSRLVLLVLPFLSLRSLPTAAYHLIHWTSFIPHV